MLLTLKLFSTKPLDVNIVGKSQIEHFCSANPDILALIQLPL